MPFPHSSMPLFKGRKISPNELIKVCGRGSGYLPSHGGGVRRSEAFLLLQRSFKGQATLEVIMEAQISHKP